jgi:trans-2,3-dihydro-3-hydroxyanthranilate isomerase
VDLEWSGDRLAFAWMSQPNPVYGPVVDNRAAVAATLGLDENDLLAGAPVQQVSCAVPFLFVPLRDPETVDRAISDASAFRRLAQSSGVDLPIFLFALDAGSASASTTDSSSKSPRTDTAGSADARRGSAAAPVMVYSRMFAPEFGITEDPATGIASGPLGCYLLRHGLVTPDAAQAIVSRQGVAMGRASRVHISIGMADAIINDVKIGGEAVLVARGELLV